MQSESPKERIPTPSELEAAMQFLKPHELELYNQYTDAIDGITDHLTDGTDIVELYLAINERLPMARMVYEKVWELAKTKVKNLNGDRN